MKSEDNSSLPGVTLPQCGPPRLLVGQTALVTGASSGIGKSIATAIATAGAAVAVNYPFDSEHSPAAEVRAWRMRMNEMPSKNLA